MNKSIAIIGLGYVGLPLAIEFSKLYRVIGFDINNKRVSLLQKNIDITGEISTSDIKKTNLKFTSDENDLTGTNIFIITVPTPVDEKNLPDLSLVINATKMISKYIKKKSYIIYESTVYPGVTEDICGKLITEITSLKLNQDFFLGYSPERINPGDKKHRLINIKKITSGSSSSAANFVDQLYKTIITAGTYKASSIKVAEAAKVIENTQRDINIAFMNELSIIFNKLNLSTKEVLDAAKTKWNFIDFNPGLVGGHCIGVDPYYLTYLSNKIGYNSKIISASRQLNDSMSKYVSEKIINLIQIEKPKILFMGITFKENCPDTRNSKNLDLLNFLQKKYKNISVYDPIADIDESIKNSLHIISEPKIYFYDVVILAVPHNKFLKSKFFINKFLKESGIIIDIKACLKNSRVVFSL